MPGIGVGDKNVRDAVRRQRRVQRRRVRVGNDRILLSVRNDRGNGSRRIGDRGVFRGELRDDLVRDVLSDDRRNELQIAVLEHHAVRVVIRVGQIRRRGLAAHGDGPIFASAGVW